MHKIIRKSLLSTTLFTFSLLALVLLPMSSALAVGNAGVGGKPANPDPVNPRSYSIFVYNLLPGDTRKDAITIVNNSDETKTIEVYGVDSQSSSDGAFACAQKADIAVGVGTWITMSKTEVTLAPASEQNVAFTINVPSSASVGEQNGCIAIQDKGTESTAKGGVTLSFRSAIRLIVTIPGEITKELDFVGPVQSGIITDSIRLIAGLKNNGNVSLDINLDVYIKNALGMKIRSAGGEYPVLANTQATFNFEVDPAFWGGWYLVGANATYNDDVSKSVGQSGNEVTISSPQQWIFVSPQPLALAAEIVALVVIVGGVVFMIWRKRKFDKTYKEAGIHLVIEGDTLNKIAKKYKVEWKQIAKFNKLNAPYHIEPQQKLKIPGRPGKPKKVT